MKCPNCETENNPKDKTCINCGKPLPAAAPTAAAKQARLRKCRRCGIEHRTGFCPKCGRWNGPAPGGVITIAVFAIVNSALPLAVGLPLLLLADRTEVATVGLAVMIVVSVLACGNLVVAINLLRLRQWAVIAFRVILIVGIVLVASVSLLSFIQDQSPLNLVNAIVPVGVNVFLLSYLGRKSYLFSNQGSGSVKEVVRRRCSHCGNEELTSFDRVRPKCREELA